MEQPEKEHQNQANFDLSFMSWALDRIAQEHENNMKAAEELGYDAVFTLKERTPNSPKTKKNDV